MTVHVRVETRVLGDASGSSMDDVNVVLPATRTSITDLIRVTVEEQVRTLTARRQLTVRDLEQQLARLYGPDTVSQRPSGAGIGIPEPDMEGEVQRALDACHRGRCFVIVDGQPVVDLDAEIDLAADTRVRFLRLVPLAGG